MQNVPPCLAKIGLNPCAKALFDWQVIGNGPLHGRFTGWRIAGDELVTPLGDRLPLGLLLRLGQELWLQGGGRRRRGPASLACARPAASALPTPSGDGDPVGRSVEPRSAKSRDRCRADVPARGLRDGGMGLSGVVECNTVARPHGGSGSKA